MGYLTGQPCTQLKLLFRKEEQLLEDSPALSPTFVIYLEFFFSSLGKKMEITLTVHFFPKVSNFHVTETKETWYSMKWEQYSVSLRKFCQTQRWAQPYLKMCQVAAVYCCFYKIRREIVNIITLYGDGWWPSIVVSIAWGIELLNHYVVHLKLI